MLYHNVHVFAHALRAIDAATVGLTTLAIWSIGRRWHWWDASSGPAMLVFVAALVAFFAAVATRLRIYRARRTDPIFQELLALSRVALCAAGMSCLVTQVTTQGLPKALYGLSVLAAVVTLLALRLILRIMLRTLRRGGKDYRIWLVVGRNLRTSRIIEEILANPHFGIRVAQILDLAGDRGTMANRCLAFEQSPLNEIPQSVMESAESLRHIMSSQIIDEVLITLPLRSFYDDIEKILRLCGEAGISTRLLPEAFELARYKAELVPVGDIPLVTHYSGPDKHTALMLKRILDLIVAAAGLVILAPLFVLIGLLVKMTSPGPMLYLQTRVGLHGRQFRMLKFRTMVVGAHEQRPALAPFKDSTGLAFKLKHDPRVIRSGILLRKYHLDELPQLWNVLVGDMSLVGPRPLPPEEAQGSEWWQRRRLTMPPGLTCHWQVKGDYLIPFGDWMRMDIKYIDEWSLTQDLHILLATVRTLARGSGW